VLLDCCLERIVNAFSPRDSVARRAREAESKLHLLRMALTKLPELSNGWQMGNWALPVRGAADIVERPSFSGGFASYARFPGTETSSELRHGNEDMEGLSADKPRPDIGVQYLPYLGS
jgi:hypothetical protein